MGARGRELELIARPVSSSGQELCVKCHDTSRWVHQRLSDDGLQTVSFDPFCVPPVGENDNAASCTTPPVVATMASIQHSSATWDSVWWRLLVKRGRLPIPWILVLRQR